MTANFDPYPTLTLFESLLRAMVGFPEDLEISHKVFDASIEVRVRPHASDFARLLGKGAATHRSLAQLFGLIARGRGFRFMLHRFSEPTVGTAERAEFQANPAWPRGRILALLADVVAAAFPKSGAGAAIESRDDVTEDGLPMTRIVVRLGPEEHVDLIGMAGPALLRIFDCIGKQHGRVLVVDAIKGPAAPAEPPQPASAAGRWAGEVP